MNRKIWRYILVSVLVIGFIFLIFGNPVHRNAFKNETKDYLRETYPNQTFKIKKIMYSFKENVFVAVAKTDSGLDFFVYEDHEGEKVDTLPYTIWEDEIRRLSWEKAKEIIGPDVTVSVRVEREHNERLVKYEIIPPYAEVSNDYALQAYIKFHRTNSDVVLYEDYYEVVKWLIENKYLGTVEFVNDGQNHIIIPHDELEKIKSADEMVKFSVD